MMVYKQLITQKLLKWWFEKLNMNSIREARRSLDKLFTLTILIILTNSNLKYNIIEIV